METADEISGLAAILPSNSRVRAMIRLTSGPTVEYVTVVPVRTLVTNPACLRMPSCWETFACFAPMASASSLTE